MPTTALAGDRWKSELGDRSLLQPVGVFQSITFPLYDKQFENPEVRKAISMGIDREAVIKVAFNNTRQPADAWAPPSSRATSLPAVTRASSMRPRPRRCWTRPVASTAP